MTGHNKFCTTPAARFTATPVGAPDEREELRRLLATWYRRGAPWKDEPTLGQFRASLSRRTQAGLLARVDLLIDRHGTDCRLADLRLAHLLDL